MLEKGDPYRYFVDKRNEETAEIGHRRLEGFKLLSLDEIFRDYPNQFLALRPVFFDNSFSGFSKARIIALANSYEELKIELDRMTRYRKFINDISISFFYTGNKP